MNNEEKTKKQLEEEEIFRLAKQFNKENELMNIEMLSSQKEMSSMVRDFIKTSKDNSKDINKLSDKQMEELKENIHSKVSSLDFKDVIKEYDGVDLILNPITQIECVGKTLWESIKFINEIYDIKQLEKMLERDVKNKDDFIVSSITMSKYIDKKGFKSDTKDLNESNKIDSNKVFEDNKKIDNKDNIEDKLVNNLEDISNDITNDKSNFKINKAKQSHRHTYSGK